MTQHTQLQQNGVEVMGNQAQLVDAIGKFYFPKNMMPSLTAFCPNTECSYPVFDTLAICSSCQPITEEMKFGCHSDQGAWRMNYSSTDAFDGSYNGMSCGWFFNSSDSHPMLMSGYSADPSPNGTAQVLLMRQLNFRDPLTDEKYWNGSIHFKHVPNPLANFAVVASPNIAAIYANKTPEAFECVMQFCTKTIAATFSEGQYQERVLAEFRNMTKRVEPITVEMNHIGLDYLYGQNISITPPGQDETFFVSNTSALKARFAFDRVLPSYLTLDTGGQVPHLRYNNDVTEVSGQVSAQVNCSRWLQPGGIESTVTEMASVMTLALRSTQHSTLVFGTGVIETYVHVRWPFFSLPLIVVGLTTILLGVTMIEATGTEAGRKSSLFTLIHGLSPFARASMSNSRSLYETRTQAKKVAVYLDIKGECRYLESTKNDLAGP